MSPFCPSKERPALPPRPQRTIALEAHPIVPGLCAECRCKRKRGGQRYRDGRQNCRENEGDHLANRHFMGTGVRHQHDDDYAIEDGKISHHAHNGFLLGTLDMGGADEFRGVSKLRAAPVAVTIAVASPRRTSAPA
jgi:hypothetical protein